MTTVVVAGRPLVACWRLARQFACYALLGGCGAVVDLAVFASLTHRTGVPVVPANTVSVLCGILTSFVLNARWTFPRSAGWRPAMIKFVVVGLMGLLASSAMISLLADVLQVPPLAAKLAIIPLVAMGQFHANRRWTFGRAD